MMLHPLVYTVRQLLITESLLSTGSRVLVGVSAGADSMALLHILAALRSDFSLTLVAAYVDHGLRPSETPAEWACVQEAADRLDVERASVIVDVQAAAKARRMSLEHAARDLRYQAFVELQHQWNTDVLAIAHTADDQVEELLLRLLRGGSRKALAGMRLRSGKVLRPLLGIRKTALLAYLRDEAVTFCHDSSNDELHFLRNRIRLHLLPLLEDQYDSGIRQALLKTADNLSEDEELLELLLDAQWAAVVSTLPPAARNPTHFRLDREAFCRLHPALQRRLIEKLLWMMDNTAQYEQILAVSSAARTGRTGSELHLSRGLRVLVDRDALEFSYPKGKGSWRGRLSPP